MKEASQEITYPKGLPRDVWILITGFLNLRDRGRFAQVCKGFNRSLSHTKGNPLSIWFHELKAQCYGEEENEGKTMLDHCQENIGDMSALLFALDKLLYRPNNSSDILSRALMSVVGNNGKLVAGSAVIIQGDKNFEARVKWVPKIGFGVMAAVIIRLLIPPQLSSVEMIMAMPALLSGLAIASLPCSKKTGVANYYKHPGFWKKVDALSVEELEKLPNIKSKKENHQRNWNNLIKVAKFSVGSLGVTLLIVLAMLYALSNNVVMSHAPRL